MSVENLCLFKTYREKYLKTPNFKINQLKPLKFKRKLCLRLSLREKRLSCMMLYMFYSRHSYYHYRSLQAWTLGLDVDVLVSVQSTIIKASIYLA